MPQLNPSPWLMIFLLVWTLFMLILLNKTLNSFYHNNPSTTEMKETLPPTWNWPWY